MSSENSSAEKLLHQILAANSLSPGRETIVPENSTVEELLHRIFFETLIDQKIPPLKDNSLGKSKELHLSCVHPLLTGLLLEGVAKEDELFETWQFAHEFKLFPIPGHGKIF